MVVIRHFQLFYVQCNTVCAMKCKIHCGVCLCMCTCTRFGAEYLEIRKRLQIEARFQWYTNSKWHKMAIANQWSHVQWRHMTLKGQGRSGVAMVSGARGQTLGEAPPPRHFLPTTTPITQLSVINRFIQNHIKYNQIYYTVSQKKRPNFATV